MLGKIKVRWYDKRQQWKELSLRHKIIVLTTALLVVGASSAAAYISLSSKSEPAIEILKKPKTTVPSPLTGIEVKPELAKRPVTAVMIENSTAARPHSGLLQAGIAFEAIAEGGITRFIVLYQESDPSYIGPVRSLRPYYLDWAAPFQASIAHVGGSPAALRQVRSGDFRDIDQFFNAGSYWRQPTRSSPHNVYTSFKKLDALNKSKGYKSSKFTSWPRKKEQRPEFAAVHNISLNVSSALYNVRYTYDQKSNSYKRFLGGAPHISTNTPTGKGKQISPKVVIAMVMGYGIASNGQHSAYKVNGSGQMYVFQDGGVTVGTWSKASRRAQFEFKDANGQTLSLNPGQTWVTVVGSKGRVAYKILKPPAEDNATQQ